MNNKITELAILEIHCSQYMIFKRMADREFNKPAEKWTKIDIKSLKYHIGRMKGLEKAIRKTMNKYEQPFIEPRYIKNIIMHRYDRNKWFGLVE